MKNEVTLWKCGKCGLDKPILQFRRRVSLGMRSLHIDNTCTSCKNKRAFALLKLEMLAALGGKCACCGETHPYLLTLEHINGRNFKQRRHRKEPGEKATNTYVEIRRAKREGWDPTKWELLCWNCNCSKGHYGQCPHRTGITREQVLASLRFTSEATGGRQNSVAKMVEGGKATRYKEGQERPEMLGNKFAAHLTEEQVRQIKMLRGTGRLQKEVAAQFGVSRSLIGLLWSDKRWKELQVN